MNNPNKIYIGDLPNELNDGWDYATRPILKNDTEYVRTALIKRLIEDYERRINTAKSMLRLEKKSIVRRRMQAKLSSYRTFVGELKRIIQ